jgi:hypothetical protein
MSRGKRVDRRRLYWWQSVSSSARQLSIGRCRAVSAPDHKPAAESELNEAVCFATGRRTGALQSSFLENPTASSLPRHMEPEIVSVGL